MSWFSRIAKGIITPSSDKKEVKEGLWYKCPECKKIVTSQDHAKNFWVCECGFHERISAKDYFSFLFDDGKYSELFANIVSADPLQFVDTKKYVDRLKSTMKSTGLKDALMTAVGPIENQPVVIAAMDFKFIGGSMGAVVGEKIARSVDLCLEKKLPLIIISRSGGARMMEGGYSLMQLAKISAKLTLLSDAKLPYISLVTDPTTGGVTASFAMLGDLNIAEPGALVGFAGPRVIKETIGKDLPPGFQSAEFVMEKGFLDFIVHRKDMKQKISQVFRLLAP